MACPVNSEAVIPFNTFFNRSGNNLRNKCPFPFVLHALRYKAGFLLSRIGLIVLKYLFLVFLVSGAFPLFAQDKHLDIAWCGEEIKLDGELYETVWLTAQKANDFVLNFPFDTGRAESKTEVMMAYNSQYLYIAARCYDDMSSQVVVNLRRDFALKTSDNFSVVIDPYLDGANGFNFALTPLGTQREALIQNGDQSFVIWDNKWYSEVKRHADSWTVEMAIPFSTLRFNSGLSTWKVNFSRTDVSDNEISTWVLIPRTYPLTVLSLTGALHWDKPIEKTGKNISFIPYAGINTGKNHFPVNSKPKTRLDVGADAKIAVTSSLNLDMTFNPDFSNVEVDRQVSNLSRFEIFFPEQRQFFNENTDLFSSFGFSRIRPFFSRRIGLVSNPNAPGFLPARILYGARLSGKLNPKLRIGLLNVQTADDQSLNYQGNNYTVATFQQKVFARSNLAGILVNRQIFKNDSGDFSFRQNKFNRVLGLDYNLLSKDNRWSGKFFYHQSFENQKRSDDYAHAVYLMYFVPNYTLIWNHEIVGSGYNPEMGYLQRPKGFFRIEPEARFRHYPSKSRVNYYSLGLYNDTYWDRYRQVSDQLYQISGQMVRKNTSSFSLSFTREYTRLYNGGFDPTNTGSRKLDSNSVYWYNYLNLGYTSDNRRVFSGYMQLRSGQYFNGWLNTLDGGFTLRSGSWANWSLIYTFNQFFFPQPYPDTRFWLLGPRAELSFSKSHFLTTFLQYNQQAKNININVRYQWRFAPVSDFFIVYAENYLPEPWKTKNRSLVVKLVYWFNI